MARIVVVDDEYSQLRLLGDILRRFCPEYEIETFDDSTEAMEYLLEHEVEVLLLDIKMPGMTGFQLLSHIIRDDDMMVVIISAYNDFEFAQTAIRKGVDEYLLKPVSRKEIDRLSQQIKKHIGRVEQRRQQAQERETALPILGSLTPSEINRLLSRWIEQNLKEEERKKICSLFPCNMGFAVVIRLTQRKRIRELYSSGYLQYSIVPKIQQMIYGHLQVCGKILTGIGDWNSLEILVVAGDVNEDSREQAQGLLKHVMRQVEKEMGIAFAAGISSLSYNLTGQIGICYRQALKALRYGYVMNHGRCQQYKESLEENETGSPMRFFEAGVTEVSGWRAMGEQQLKEAVQKGFNDLCRHSADVELDLLVRQFIYLFRSGASYVSEFYSTESGADILQKIEQNLMYEEDCAGLCGNLKNAIEQLFSVVKNDSASDMAENMKRCRHYINEHYSEPVSLVSLSDYIHLSPSYVSSMFKAFMGIGFKEYLTRVRMKKACEMLRDTGMKVYEIAIKAGYSDYISFIKSFKKEIGLTPQKYRMVTNDCEKNDSELDWMETQA